MSAFHHMLRELQWLPVRERIESTLVVLVYNTLNGVSPQYVADDCQLTMHYHRPPTTLIDVATCEVLRTHTSLGD